MRVDLVRHARLVDADLLGLRTGRGDPHARALRLVHASVFVPESLSPRLRAEVHEVATHHDDPAVRAMLAAAERVVGVPIDPVDALVDALGAAGEAAHEALVTAVGLAAPWLPFDDRWTVAVTRGSARVDATLVVAVLAMDGEPGDRRAWLDGLIRRLPRLERHPVVGALADGLDVPNPLAPWLVDVDRAVAARLGAVLPATAEQLPLDLGRDAPSGSRRAARRALFGREALPELTVETRLARTTGHPLTGHQVTAPPRRDEDLA